MFKEKMFQTKVCLYTVTLKKNPPGFVDSMLSNICATCNDKTTQVHV